MSPLGLKFLVDVGVGGRVEEYLTKRGFDVKTVLDLDPRMPDEEIIRLAALEARMVVTMDKDFGELVYHSLMDHCGVLLLRLEEATGKEKLNVIAEIIEKFSDRMRGCFCVYKNNKFRIRKIQR